MCLAVVSGDLKLVVRISLFQKLSASFSTVVQAASKINDMRENVIGQLVRIPVVIFDA